MELERRAAVHAALGDPARLAIVDELAVSDRSPTELARMIGVESNLLAHHLDVLGAAGLIGRSRSSGDGRRRYVRLIRSQLGRATNTRRIEAGPALFVCTANSARSQLAAALWRDRSGAAASCAGTNPAKRVHPAAIAAARRVGLDLTGAIPRALPSHEPLPALVITVCDNAHEAVAADPTWLHWSIPDPVPVGTAAAFDLAVEELRQRIESVLLPTGMTS